MEERQRMGRLLPEDLKPRIEEFSREQLVALRFASDGELPGLARKVLNEKLTDRTAIKKLVQHWRADRLRA
jgi:anti-sigma factor RsiW